jgi:hypothetical protein
LFWFTLPRKSGNPARVGNFIPGFVVLYSG